MKEEKSVQLDDFHFSQISVGDQSEISLTEEPRYKRLNGLPSYMIQAIVNNIE